jgi:hypothetical protein
MQYDCQKLTEAVQNLQQMKQDFDTKYRDGVGIDVQVSMNQKEDITSEIETAQAHITVSEKEAKRIFGRDYLGPEAVGEAFGIKLEVDSIPNIPFKKKELERAKELDQMLVLRIDKTPDGVALTMDHITNLLNNTTTKDGGLILYDAVAPYIDEKFYEREAPVAGWALVCKTGVPDMESKKGLGGDGYINDMELTDTTVEYLKKVFPAEMPLQYQEAIEQYLALRQSIEQRIFTPNFRVAAEMLESLELTKLTCPSPVEMVYDLVMYCQNNLKRLFDIGYFRTSRLCRNGYFVSVGDYDKWGVNIDSDGPEHEFDDSKIAFSRRV